MEEGLKQTGDERIKSELERLKGVTESETGSDNSNGNPTEDTENMKISVPKIDDFDRENIEKALSEANIKYTITEEYSDDVPAGKIISDNIPDDNEISGNDTVEIVISLGTEKVNVPDFSNLTYSEAEALAEENRLTVSRNDVYSSDVKENHVITQIIPVNAQVPVNTKVILTVSRGVEMVEVPDLIGLTKEQAEKILNDNKLNGVFSEEYSDTVEEGKIISQSLSVSQMVEADSDIAISISKGKEIMSAYLVSELVKPTKEMEAYGYKFEYENGFLTKIYEYWEEREFATNPIRIYTFDYSFDGNVVTITETQTTTYDSEKYQYTYTYNILDKELYKNESPDYMERYPTYKINSDNSLSTTYFYLDYSDYGLEDNVVYVYDDDVVPKVKEVKEENIGIGYSYSVSGEKYEHHGWESEPQYVTGLYTYLKISAESYLLDMDRLILEEFIRGQGNY